ncbi:MAG: septum formation initiator family protein [Spirochaetes bacterium]|nr:septum formation initiator family protein [Spirochaetota bacterium]
MNLLTRILATLYIFTVVYLALSFVYGKTGLLATKELVAYREKINSNITELRKANIELARRLQTLNTREKIELKAREMGFIASDERRIFLSGLERPNVYHSVGNIIYMNKVPKDNSQFIRAMSFIFALLFYILSTVLLPEKNGTKKIKQHNRQDYGEIAKQRHYNNAV